MPSVLTLPRVAQRYRRVGVVMNHARADDVIKLFFIISFVDALLFEFDVFAPTCAEVPFANRE